MGLAEIVPVVDDVERSARFSRGGRRPDARDAGRGRLGLVLGGRARPYAARCPPQRPLLFEEHSPLPEGRRWGRVHYAFVVPHERLEAAVEHVRTGGVEVHGPTRFDWMRATSYYFYDPDGNLLEFWSPGPGETTKETA